MHRKKISAIAGVVLPGLGDQPAGADIAIEGAPIDRVFKSRPDLLDRFVELIDGFDIDLSDQAGNRVDEQLVSLDEVDYRLLITVLCAAYLMDDAVRRALGYAGQQALTPNRGGFGAEELVIEMMQQPKRYREA